MAHKFSFKVSPVPLLGFPLYGMDSVSGLNHFTRLIAGESFTVAGTPITITAQNVADFNAGEVVVLRTPNAVFEPNSRKVLAQNGFYAWLGLREVVYVWQRDGAVVGVTKQPSYWSESGESYTVSAIVFSAGDSISIPLSPAVDITPAQYESLAFAPIELAVPEVLTTATQSTVTVPSIWAANSVARVRNYTVTVDGVVVDAVSPGVFPTENAQEITVAEEVIFSDASRATGVDYSLVKGILLNGTEYPLTEVSDGYTITIDGRVYSVSAVQYEQYQTGGIIILDTANGTLDPLVVVTPDTAETTITADGTGLTLTAGNHASISAGGAPINIQAPTENGLGLAADSGVWALPPDSALTLTSGWYDASDDSLISAGTAWPGSPPSSLYYQETIGGVSVQTSTVVASSPWTPSELGAALLMTLDSTNAVFSGSDVQSFTVGAGLTAAREVSTPGGPLELATGGDQINGLPTFANNDARIRVDGIDGGTNDINVFVVARRSGVDGILGGISDNNDYFLFYNDGSTSAAQRGQDAATLHANGTVVTTSDQLHDAFNVDSVLSATGLRKDNNSSGLFLGGYFSDFRAFEGWWSEFIVIEGALATADRERMEGYLAHKYATTAALPGGHPYKTTAPEV